MPDTNEPSDPMRLLRQLRATGPEAPSLRQKVEMLSSLRAQSPDVALILDESLLTEVEHLRRGLETAHRKQRELKAVLDQLTAPPWHVGVYLGGGAAGHRASTALVAINGGRRVVNLGENVDQEALAIGDNVLLGPEQNVVLGRSPFASLTGETATFDRFANDRHIVIRVRDEELVVQASDSLRQSGIRSGDLVRWDRSLWLASEKLERSQGRHLFLDDTPRETFAAIGGLDRQVAELQRSIRMHYAHAATVQKYRLRRRAAVLLAGPPGTGKTLIARALANWLAELSPTRRSRFMNVKPGSLHSMWYSQSEANYREAFRVAREAGEENPDVPVVMFFDEVDAIGSARGGALSHVDDRVLTAFLAELDGLESRGNVLVVCATNRRDSLDPALLRAGGRLGDIVLEIPRPNWRAGREILARHLPEEIPYRTPGDTSETARRDLIEAAAARIYGPNGHGPLATLRLRDGKARMVTPADLVSGAVIANIARRAIEAACLRDVESGDAGVSLSDLLAAIDREFDVAVSVLTPANCHRHLDGLPQDVDVVRVERVSVPVHRTYRYLSVA